MNELKKADKIVRALRATSDANPEHRHGKLCNQAADLIDSLASQLNGANANGIIQEHIIKNGTNPLDADKIIRLTMDNADLQSQLAASHRREKAAVEDLQRLMKELGGQCCTLCTKNNSNCGFSVVFPCSSCKPQYRGPQEAEKGEAE